MTSCIQMIHYTFIYVDCTKSCLKPLKLMQLTKTMNVILAHIMYWRLCSYVLINCLSSLEGNIRLAFIGKLHNPTFEEYYTD